MDDFGVDSEYTKVVEDFLDDPDHFTTCESGCTICADIRRLKRIVIELGAGKKLAPNAMKSVKHPLLKAKLLDTVCLRAANAKVDDD